MKRGRTLIFLAGAAAYLILTTITIYTRRPWVDEAWAGVPAWSLATHGNTGTPSFDASAMGPHGMLRVDSVCYWQAPMYLVLQALWYHVFPFSLWSMRWLSATAGFAGLICWAFFLERLTGDRGPAALLFLLISCDYVVDAAGSFGRPDALSFAFQAAAYAAYMGLRRTHLGWGILVSQAFVVASGLTHPNGGILSFLGMLFLTVYFDRNRLSWRTVAGGAAPYLAGGLAWGLFILQDPAAFFSQYGAQAEGRFAGLLMPVESIRKEIGERYMHIMGLGAHSVGSSGPIFLKSLIFVAYAVALAGVLAVPALRKTRAVRALLGLMGIYLFFYTFLESYKATYYMIYLVYIYTALLAIWLDWCWSEGKLPKPLIALGVIGLLGVQAGGSILRARADDYKNRFEPAVAYLDQHASPDSLIVGSHELGFALGFGGRFLDDYRLGLASGRRPDYIVVEEIYEGRFETLREQRPKEYVELLELLKQYHEVYNRNSYRILARNAS
jgi:hypothetical protein